MGADTGYTNDPSEVTVWREVEDEVMRLVFRLHATHVPYPALAEIIALIDRYYNPRGIGIDNGGNGMSVVQDLKNLDKFRGQDYETKVRGFDFGGELSRSLIIDHHIKRELGTYDRNRCI